MSADQLTSISDVTVSFPGISQIFEVLTLQAGYNSAVVVVGTTFLGIAAGAIGTFALLRNRALMGDALAHSALPGLALAFIVGSMLGIGGKHLWLLLLGASISGVLGIVCVQLISRYSRLHEDTAIGAVLSCFFGAGVVLMSIIQSLGTGEEGGLHHFIFGQTAAMSITDTWLTSGVAIVATLACAILFKEFRVVSFDRDFAATQGWPVSRIDLAMMSLVVLVTVIGLQAVGLLLVVALLIIPAAGARFWTENLRQMIFGSSIIGGISGYLGSSASALMPRLPAGAVIVLVAGVIFFVSFLFAPARGVIARLISHTRMSLRVTLDHLLRDIYEAYEKNLRDEKSQHQFLPLEAVPLTRNWSWWQRIIVLNWLRIKQLVECNLVDGKLLIRLLPKGIKEAQIRVRSHRLWEEYIVDQTEIPVSHVDYSADFVEHVLSPEIVRQLEQSLSQKLSDTSEGKTPRSLHPLSQGG